MIRNVMLTGLLLAASATAFAKPSPEGSREVRIPLMSQHLDWHADGHRGLYIQGANGKWYYARTQGECARLRPTASIAFNAKGNQLDRFGSLRVDGWRCPLASVTESGPPASHRAH